MFDSGGYNIKLHNMHEMKNDMTGSAIVYGIFKLLSKMNVKGRFVGLLPLVENMVDSNAYRPGDIIKAYNGKTVEIINTDAEGRLIMADALAYSANFNPSLCIDIATLTGQAGSIFDNKSSVVLGNSNAHIQQIIKIGMENNEKFWELPMWNEFVNATKSKIADYRNDAPESKASTIYAGAFLSNFVPKDVNWLHLDIAGVDMLKNDISHRYSGATGEILRTLFEFLYNINSVSLYKPEKIISSRNLLTK
jgi:leucyl aminopeptidase